MNILMLEYLQYNTVYQVGSHYYAKEFSNDNNEITWINQPRPYMSNTKNNTLAEKPKEITSAVLMPFCKYPPFNSMFWSKYYLNTSIPNIYKLITMRNIDLLWMTNVKMYEISEKVKYNKMIHRMADDFSSFRGCYKNLIRLENQVVKKSDLVLVTAKNLMDKVYSLNKNVVYLPNGVNFKRFNRESYEEPAEYKLISMPKIVYVGAIDDWFDYETLVSAANRLKNIAFIIIGAITQKAKEYFGAISNIYILGKKPHDDIPNYIKHADIGIMPFLSNKLTNSIHPLKLYEYFAAGIPVVARNLEETRNMNSPARLYSNADEFCLEIKSLLDEKLNIDDLIRYAKLNTWEKRYEIIKKYI